MRLSIQRILIRMGTRAVAFVQTWRDASFFGLNGVAALRISSLDAMVDVQHPQNDLAFAMLS